MSITWVFGTDDVADHPGWLTAAVFAAAAVCLLVAARGCRVVVEPGRVVDQVAWQTVWSSAVTDIVGGEGAQRALAHLRDRGCQRPATRAAGRRARPVPGLPATWCR
ncbi:MAG: hypothetical protein M5U19_00025 [Microthrixaceae bacterium]|nr:hypothetical protein [Microthrixaceae bacterium]